MIDCGWCTGISRNPTLVLRTHFHSSSKRITGIVDKEIDAVLDKERNATSLEERKKILQTETLPTIARKAPGACAVHVGLPSMPTARRLDGSLHLPKWHAGHDQGHAGLTICFPQGRIRPGLRDNPFDENAR